MPHRLTLSLALSPHSKQRDRNSQPKSASALLSTLLPESPELANANTRSLDAPVAYWRDALGDGFRRGLLCFLLAFLVPFDLPWSLSFL